LRYFCAVHEWNEDTEPCPRCQEADAEARRSRSARSSTTTVERQRADVLIRAVVANVEGDASDIEQLFTPDVSGDSPATAARSREELAIELDERRDAFRQHDVTFRNVEVNGDLARVEWIATGLHVGPFVLERNGVTLDPTGLRLRVRAVTVARFRGDQICSWRSTWDDLTLMDRDQAA
jgi:SnoaL-like polyketide cyclase